MTSTTEPAQHRPPAESLAPVRHPPAATVTMVAGTNFVVCGSDGEIRRGGLEGFYGSDTRLVDLLHLRIDGRPLDAVRCESHERRLCTLATVGDPTEPHLLVERTTTLDHGLEIDLEIENLTADDHLVDVELVVATDFADVFDVKRGREPRAGFTGTGPVGDALELTYSSLGFHRSLRVTCTAPGDHEVLRDGWSVEVLVPGRSRRNVGFRLDPDADRPTHATPSGSDAYRPIDVTSWRAGLPEFASSIHELGRAWRTSVRDLGGLLLARDTAENRPIIAAGSPWFMALFGRDSLISGLGALPLGTPLLLGVLHALAEHQGHTVDERSEEQPGRILHELRAGEGAIRPGGWGSVYFGSVDATPLFVHAVAEAWRWGAPVEEIRSLLPAAEAAGAWMLHDADITGHGWIEYRTRGSHDRTSLSNQAWKDSDDAVRRADGSIVEGVVAMVEVQGYAVAALRALAALREAFGTGDPTPLRQRAARLVDAIDDAFWMPEHDCFALALEDGTTRVSTVTSNPGHLLWVDAVHPSRVEAFVDRLLAPDMFSGHGLRTLSSDHPSFNPLSYHNGSVWPHDTALVAAGMLERGATDAGNRLAMALLGASAQFDGRLPELFGGFDRERSAVPVPYPTSCSPQAWAAAAPLLLVRAMLGLSPEVPAAHLRVDPHLPDTAWIDLSGLDLGGTRVEIRAAGSSVTVEQSGPHLRIARSEAPGSASGASRHPAQ